MDPYGEFVSMSEKLLVSPAWGHLRTSRRAGERVEEAAVLGRISGGGQDVLVLAPTRGVFIGWIALEGELVWRGTPLGRMLGAA